MWVQRTSITIIAQGIPKTSQHKEHNESRIHDTKQKQRECTVSCFNICAIWLLLLLLLLVLLLLQLLLLLLFLLLLFLLLFLCVAAIVLRHDCAGSALDQRLLCGSPPSVLGCHPGAMPRHSGAMPCSIGPAGTQYLSLCQHIS